MRIAKPSAIAVCPQPGQNTVDSTSGFTSLGAMAHASLTESSFLPMGFTLSV